MTTYKIIIRDFLDTTSFGKGSVLVQLENVYNVCWTTYINDVGEAFFTMPQDDPKLPAIIDYVDKGVHMEVYRNNELVWAGWLGEVDETMEDVIIYGYSYESGLYYLVSDWDAQWTNQQVGDIVEALFDYGVAKTKSRIGWMPAAVIEQPWSDSAKTTVLSMPFYNIFYKRLLIGIKELCAFATSDTTNHVVFEITPAGQFYLYKDRKNTLSDIRWRLGDGKVRSYRRVRMPVDRRNQLPVVGTSPNDIDLRTTVTNTTLRDSFGLMEEPVYLQWVRDATELDRVAKIRLNRAGRTDTDLMVSFFSDVLTPYRATGADYQLGDLAAFVANRGISELAGTDTKIIVGQQIMYSRQRENVRLLLGDKI